MLEARIKRIARCFSGYQEFFTGSLVSGYITAKGKKDLAGDEIRRIMELAIANPLTREEWRKIEYYLEKDELALEEALEFRDLAGRVVREHGDRYEAWGLHLCASIMVGLARKKPGKERKRRDKEPSA